MYGWVHRLPSCNEYVFLLPIFPTYLPIFIVLHAHYKTIYFVHAKWPQQWITDAETLTCKVWIDKYKKASPAAAAQESRAYKNHVSISNTVYYIYQTLLILIGSVFLQQGNILMSWRINQHLLMLLKTGLAALSSTCHRTPSHIGQECRWQAIH